LSCFVRRGGTRPQLFLLFSSEENINFPRFKRKKSRRGKKKKRGREKEHGARDRQLIVCLKSKLVIQSYIREKGAREESLFFFIFLRCCVPAAGHFDWNKRERNMREKKEK
jgi:hypothetical protein